MFIRIIRPPDMEILVNVDLISRIEVEYVIPIDEHNYQTVTLQQGVDDPRAIRSYRVHVAGEVILLIANPDDPVTKIVEEIYLNAVKS